MPLKFGGWGEVDGAVAVVGDGAPAGAVQIEVRSVLSTSVATVIVTVVSSSVVAVPLAATGGSFTDATVIVAVAFEVAVPSEAA